MVVLGFIEGSLLHASLLLGALRSDHSDELRELDSLDKIFVEVVFVNFLLREVIRFQALRFLEAVVGLNQFLHSVDALSRGWVVALLARTGPKLLVLTVVPLVR